tara:strand:- start:347 stop:958 length:612 start_codon:yes stop_codon:yes gene_type:complete
VHNFELVVIGAHFGVWLKDEISKILDKNILLVEPVPYNYKILQKEYSNSQNIKICTNAIYDENKKEKFYYVKENSVGKLGKHWASGIGSFDKQHILNHRSKRFKVEDKDIEIIDVDFITFNNLIEKYSIKSINKLQVDVEGAEYKILNSIDFSKIEIKKIIFESKHFDGTFKEGEKLKEFKNKLVIAGYKLNQLDEENILAEK